MPSEDFKLSHVAVRVLADLTSIHICMIVALAISVFHLCRFRKQVHSRLPRPAIFQSAVSKAMRNAYLQRRVGPQPYSSISDRPNSHSASRTYVDALYIGTRQ